MATFRSTGLYRALLAFGAVTLTSLLGVWISRALENNFEGATAWADGFAVICAVAGVPFLCLGGLLLIRRRRSRI